MSEIKGAKIDEHLLSGQQEDKLVIFAGAGVSMGHPSDYPDFRRLAGQIARGSKLKLSANEPIEHFLGDYVTKACTYTKRQPKYCQIQIHGLNRFIGTFSGFMREIQSGFV